MSELVKRSLTGTIFVIVMLAAILWNPFSLFALVSVISGIALYEFYRIFKGKGYSPLVWGGIISGFLILLCDFLVWQSFIPFKYLELIILPLIAIWFSFIFVKREDHIKSLMITVTGLLYILLPLALLLFLTQNVLTGSVYNPEILIGTLIIVWTFDTGAYLSGIMFGKHRMAPEISPKKSWEGFFGGMIFAVIAGIVYAHLTSLLNTTDWVILSLIIGLTGTAGDLFESLIKREGGVKDSGKIMPGHGGILDRFDSILLIIPFVFLYLYLIKI